MIRTIIIDDEPLARAYVVELLQPYASVKVVAECGDGFDGLKAIAALRPDLLFLDIQMPRISGFEMLELVESPPAVIFTTAYDAYALKAFEAHAVDYLLKPFSKERFDKALRRFIQATPGEKRPEMIAPLLETVAAGRPAERIVVRDGTRIHIINFENIHYIEAADDYVRVHTRDGHYLKNSTMAHLEASLDPSRFVRVHRSFILNVAEITRIDPYEKDGHLAVLRSGARIGVSKGGYARLRRVLGM